MKDGYFQVGIDDESSDLCAFGTPFGLYKFCRLPFGICSAPEVFQRLNCECFGDIAGVGIYFDDIIITGSSELEHDQNLQLVLERAEKFNIKFNKQKIQFKSKQVRFMGQYFSKRGIEPSDEYVKAIVDMPIPSNKQDLLRFLGMGKYLSKFIPNMSKITAPLRNLTHNNADWHWDSEHKNSFDQLKHLITNSPVLAFFDPSYPIEIETDASKDGIGSCIMQQGHPIAFASRSLSKSEIRYAQIEKELLAIVFSCQKFHYLIYGAQNVTLFSDHKPLEAIFKKELQQVPPRLQRMLLKVLHYNLRVIYKPGKYLYISDTLSRAFLNEKNLDLELELEYVVHSVTRNLPISVEKKNRIKQAYKSDLSLQKLIQVVSSEWPENKKLIPECIRHYHKIKDFLFVSDSLLFFNYRLIVPVGLRQEMLIKLHEGHVGIEKVKSRARGIFYWPGMNLDIENYIKKCSTCERFARKNNKQTLLPYPIPDRPWQRVGADIFSYANNSYLVVIDSYSTWLEILLLKNKTAHEVILKLKILFSKFGSPDQLICDNIPFGSYSMYEFAKEWNFDIVTRSPNYPRSNGLAEKAVGIAKKMLKKSIVEGKDIFESLLQYRNSPLKYIDYSPSQLLMNRMCKTKLPVCADLLQPALCENVANKLQLRQNYNEAHYNKTATDLSDLAPNQNISVYNHINQRWEPSKILEFDKTPRSYKVLDESGNVLRRNRFDLRESNNEFNLVDNQSSDERFNFTENDSSQNISVTPYERSQSVAVRDSAHSSNEPNHKMDSPKSKTRSGRIIKKPVKLNL